jgi:hypothetical protein
MKSMALELHVEVMMNDKKQDRGDENTSDESMFWE